MRKVERRKHIERDARQFGRLPLQCHAFWLTSRHKHGVWVMTDAAKTLRIMSLPQIEGF